MIQSVTFEEAKQLLDSDPACLLLDVREEEEYTSGHAVGAALFPVGAIDAVSAQAQIPAKDTPILVYCRTGRRSLQAAHILAGLGYTRLYDLGCLVGWPYGITYGLDY